MRRLVNQKARNSTVQIAVLACSKGAEVYSIIWTIRSARPDLKIHLYAVDISPEIVDFARRGVYSRKGLDGMALREDERTQTENVLWNTCRDQNAPIFERMTDHEFAAMFELQGDYAAIRPWLKQGITWLCADAGDPELVSHMGPQDIVVANRFLCHMKPAAAERCLLRVARLVKPGGYLFLSGVDLDVRTKVVQKMGCKPVTEFIREIHEGDASLNEGWPLEYWGLEPLRENRRDWEIRYASVFQMAPTDPVDVRMHAFH
jgi:chemotaxis methyl-accepting protein methylase